MDSVKIKFRTSSITDKEGVIYYQIIHNRVIRQLKTEYRIFSDEWDTDTSSVKITTEHRRTPLLAIQENISWDTKRLQSIIRRFENQHLQYHTDDIVTAFNTPSDSQTLFNFMRSLIVQLKQMGRLRTSETYTATLKSIMAFRKNKDLLLEEITPELMMMFEVYLQNRGLTRNSTSFYMRILRAVFNRAVEKNLVEQCHPFRHVYTGIDKTVKRAVPLSIIKQIKKLDLSTEPALDFARDMFLFSFYTRGMSFIDMAYLKRSNLNNGILSYRRRKTGQLLFIKWEKCMQNIIDKYDTKLSNYLLPILKYPYTHERSQYKNALSVINRNLKEIAQRINCPIPLTLYVARHSWASIAQGKNIPISVISQGLGHESELTTQIYLASLDKSVIDNANAHILKCL